MSFIRGVFSRWWNPAEEGTSESTPASPTAAPSHESSSYRLAGATTEDIYKRLVATAEHASTATKIDVIRRFVSSPTIGTKQSVGDLFESLFTHGTAEEWRDEIYPGLLSIIHDTSVTHAAVVSKRAFLAWLVKGIMSQS